MELTCEICEEMYGNNDRDERAPRILKCGHTFCTKCLKDMASRSQGKLTCPIDRIFICNAIEIMNITINRTIFTLLEKAKESNRIQNQQNQLNSSLASVSSRQQIDYHFKFITLGEVSTGKTCISKRYVSSRYDEVYQVTFLDLFTKVKRFQGKTVQISIWDTSGSERYQGITSGYVKGSHGVLFTFNVNDRGTFNKLRDWIVFFNSLNSNMDCVKVLIGNQIDLNSREVDKKEAEKFASQHGLTYFETSARLNINVEKAFDYIADTLVDKMKQLDGDQLTRSIQLRKQQSKKSDKCYNYNYYYSKC